MPITLPSRTLTPQEEEGLLHMQGLYNEGQLAQTPPGPTKTPIQYFAMISRAWLAAYRKEKVQAAADAAAAAVIQGSPPDP